MSIDILQVRLDRHSVYVCVTGRDVSVASQHTERCGLACTVYT